MAGLFFFFFCAISCDGNESLFLVLASKWLVTRQGRYLLLIRHEFMRVHERDVFVYSFPLCVYRNFEVMHTCIQIPPQVFTQIVKQFVSLKLTHMWNLHADWLHTKQCGQASIKVCSQIRRQN